MHIFDFLKRKNKNIRKGPTKRKETYIRENYTAIVSSGEDDENYIEPQFDNLSYTQVNTLYERSPLLKKYIKIITDECLRYRLCALPKEEYKDNKQSKQRADAINNTFLLCNQIETFNEVREKYIKDMLLYGRAGVEIEPTNSKKLEALYAVPGYAIRLNVDKTGSNFIDPAKAYFLLNPNNPGGSATATFAYDTFIYYVFDKVSDRVYGDVPIDCIQTELMTDIRAARSLEVGLNGLKAGVLCLPRGPSKVLKDVVTRLINLVKNNAKSKLAAVNTDDVKFVDLTNLTILDNLKVQQWITRKANIYNIPIFKLGYETDIGSLSAREQKDDFRALIEGIIKYEVDKLNAGLIKRKLNYDDVEITCPEFATKLEYERVRVAVRLVNGNIITPNEARRRYLNLSPLDDPRADQLQIPETAAGTGSTNAEKNDTPTKSPLVKKKKKT